MSLKRALVSAITAGRRRAEKPSVTQACTPLRMIFSMLSTLGSCAYSSNGNGACASSAAVAASSAADGLAVRMKIMSGSTAVARLTRRETSSTSSTTL